MKDWAELAPEASAWPEDPRAEPLAGTEGWQPVARAPELEPEPRSEPVQLPEVEPGFEPEIPVRRFGQPVDETALAEIQHAVDEEEKFQPGDGLPHFLTAERGPDTVMLNQADPHASPDGFAELVYAARTKSAEYEPEKPPPGPPVRTSSKRFFILLIVLFVLVCVALEHKAVEHVLPGTVKVFNGLGLK